MAHIYKLSAYPKETKLRDGTTIVMKPMSQDDGKALLKLFLRIPDKERYYLKEDVTSPKVINRWVRDLDYDRALPLLAWADDQIVADGTLHRTRVMARRHIGELRIVVDPDYRARGLGTLMMQELATIASAQGVERLIIQAVESKEDAAIKAAKAIGFFKVATLKGHAKDPDGRPNDLALMELPLGRWFEWWTY